MPVLLSAKMYPDELEIIKSFLVKFDCRQNHIIRFIRKNRLPGVEEKKCSKGVHQMKLGQTAYVYNGKRHGFASAFCSDMACFLNQLDRQTVSQFIKEE